MKTPDGYVPGFDTNTRPKRARWWNKPWTERGVSMAIGVPAMQLTDEQLQAGEDIDA